MHGELSLECDVDSLILEPAFKGTEVEAFAKKLPCKIGWHQGFELHVDGITKHTEYRGLKYVTLAKELAQDGFINPLILGETVEKHGYDSQDVKKIWHYLARFSDQNKAA